MRLAVALEEADRQAVLLALAILALTRPGWQHYLGTIADELQGRDLFDTFRGLNADETDRILARAGPLLERLARRLPAP